jgi:hypothetical protein
MLHGRGSSQAASTGLPSRVAGLLEAAMEDDDFGIVVLAR